MTRSAKYLSYAVLLGALTLSAHAAQRRAHARAPKAKNAAAAAPPAPTPAGRITIDKVEPVEAARGQSVTVTGKFPEADKIVVELKRTELGQSTATGGGAGSKAAAPPINVEPVTVTAPQSSFSFVVPFGIPLGTYQVLVSFMQKGVTSTPLIAPLRPDGMLHVVTNDPVKIEKIYPAVSYPVKDHFSFKVRGEGFGPLPEDNALVIEGLDRDVLTACRGQETSADCVNVAVSDNGSELLFSNIPLGDFKGPLQIQVRVGERYSEKKEITLARVERKYPATIAIILLMVLASLIFIILRGRRRAVTGGRSPGILSAIFLDTETNTYSLSKFQFYAWTAAALLGYVYLTVSKSWVQGDFSFADIPGNLPGIIFISASTTVVAVGITSSKGSKGAGEMHPSLADFVSSGGVIAAERLQFFVWTIIGVCAFVFLTLSIEPATIHELPTVPERFLYLMGISSFGYLGGKLARRPGPVISQIEAETGSLTLTIHGSNLSPDGNFRIDDADLPPNLLKDEEHPDGRPQVLTTDEQPGFAKVLRMVINIADPATQKWLTGPHTLTLTNPDGQKASWTFTPTAAQSAPTGQVDNQAASQNQVGTVEPVQAKPDQPLPTANPPAGPLQGSTTQPASETLSVTPGGDGVGATQVQDSGATQAQGATTITDVSPTSGPVNGGTPVVISGANFATSVAVSFGDTQAANVTVLSPTALIALTPPHPAGAVNVLVQTPDGGSTSFAGSFTYAEDASISPGSTSEQEG